LLIMTDADGAYTAPAGYVTSPGDCDDADAAISPAAPEITNDGVDNNCNGLTDEELILAWYDQDLDGYGDPNFETMALTPLVVGLVPAGGTPDCDDANSSVNPGTPEIDGDGFDNNCDGISN
jgi:hypothetical protein